MPQPVLARFSTTHTTTFAYSHVYFRCFPILLATSFRVFVLNDESMNFQPISKLSVQLHTWGRGSSSAWAVTRQMLRSNLTVNLNRAVKCPSGAAKGTGAPVIVSHLVDMERTHPVQEIPSYFRSGGARVSASTLFLIIRTAAFYFKQTWGGCNTRSP